MNRLQKDVILAVAKCVEPLTPALWKCSTVRNTGEVAFCPMNINFCSIEINGTGMHASHAVLDLISSLRSL